jgi:hypothetical protein
MPYRIREKEGYIEVRVSGDTSEWEVLGIVYRLWRRDPHKKVPDLWVFAPDAVVHVSAFGFIAKGIARLCPPGFRGTKSAMVATGGFQHAAMELYRAAAKDQPFELRVFPSRAEALQWLRQGQPGEASRQDDLSDGPV